MLNVSLRCAWFLASLACAGLPLGAQQMPMGMHPGTAISLDQVEHPEACEICRMKRTMFAQSRMLAAYADGSLGACSISCMSLGMRKRPERKILALKVADYADPKTLIDARTAVWVVGGDLRGVMTAKAKWAFARTADAEAFISKQGGRIMTFDQCLDLASQERTQ